MNLFRSFAFSGFPFQMRVARGLGLSIAAASLFVAGCGGGQKRPVLTEAQLYERAQADAEDMYEHFDYGTTKLIERQREEMEADDSELPTLNILAMSGGGDYGAFGAGFLNGWRESTDPEYQFPNFDAVTGVSTGALLAPFAYLGTDEALETVDSFYRNPKKDWVRDRGLLFFLPKNPSFMTIPGLDRDVRAAIDEDFIAQMAERSREGKVLIISATDLDLGRQRFWEVGMQAENAMADGDFKKVQDILLSSAAIPMVFPPVQIGDSIYGDGGVTANVFLRLDPKAPNGFIAKWREAYPNDPLPRVRFWVIINNQLARVPKTVQPRWPSVVGPSLETAIRFATLAEVRWLAAEVDYVNAVYDTDIELWVTAIPNEWRAPVKGDFKKETMESLSDLGRRMGAELSSWTLWAGPEE